MPAERALFITLFLCAVALRIIFIFHYRPDSDEPQHLHVAWGWANGLPQYSETFDNHAPLFYLVNAPLVALLGERADILILMRMAMLPVYALTVWAIGAIAKSMFGLRAGLWAAVILAFYPNFFRYSVEYRTDDMWVMFWALGLAALLGGAFTARRGFAGGLMLGAAMSVSFKTTVMLLALLIALGLLPVVSAEFRRGFTWRGFARNAAAVVAGLCIVPAAIMVMIKSMGLWDAFVYCAITHNVIPDDGNLSFSSRFIYPFLYFPLFGWCAWRISSRPPTPGAGSRAACVFLVAGIYYALLHTFWPVVQDQTRISIYPMSVLAAVMLPYLFRNVSFGESGTKVDDAAARPHRTMRFHLVIATAEAALLVCLVPPWIDDMKPMTQFHDTVLKLTRPGELILDQKGETVFRKRAYYYVLERFTLKRLWKRLIPNTIAEDCVANGACVSVNKKISDILRDAYRFPRRTQLFLQDHFIDTGLLSVAGGYLDNVTTSDAASLPFDVVIPAWYAIVNPKGAARGRLDGAGYDGPRFLAAGRHEFITTTQQGRLAFVWAPAIERGFSPFGAIRP
ncbi:MAG: glycosyltransferase family 39 protein [bacterium]